MTVKQRPWTPGPAGVTIISGTGSFPRCDLGKLAATLTDQSAVHLQTWDAQGICKPEHI